MYKVILLAPTPPPASGIASWTMRMLSCGLGDRWEPVVVDEKVIGKRGVYSNYRKNLWEETVRTYRIWNDLGRKILDKDVKIVQSCIPASTFGMIREYVCMLIAHGFGKKYIVHYRCTLPNYTRPGINTFLCKKLSQKADMVFVLNGPSAEMIREMVGEKFKLIPNFIELKDVVKEKRPARMDIQTVVYTGGVSEIKGCDVLIESAREFPEIRFRLVGEVSEQIRAMPLPDNVILTGATDKQGVARELHQADVYAFLSVFKGEGFSNSLLEAMADGLPCIVTDWAANADMVLHGKCGYVVKSCSVEEFKKAMQALRSPETREKMSEECVRRVRECYSETQVIEQYVAAYDELIGE